MAGPTSSAVLQWLNMGPQLVHNEISNSSYQTLICEYKRVEEGKPGIMYWKATGAKTRARAQVDIYSTTYMHLPYHLTMLALSFC